MPHSPLVVDAILFDMDGTLVDSNSVVDEMWGRFAVTLGLDPQAVRTFAHGTPSTATLRRFLPTHESFDDWFAKIAVWESENFGHVGAVAGAVELVASLPADRWAVVTSALRDAARIRLEGVGFPAPLVLIGADDVTRGKPDPEGFLAAAEALGVDPGRCVVFEDSPAGLEAALAAGAQAVVVGDLDAPVTLGLRRIRDWTGVNYERTSEGRLRIDGVPSNPESPWRARD
ncbi:MAG: HAD-IA family hydrolase [Demequinaceae bacterium]|nr:HAD-IA family hydrolase [Demequinaceae bacterium]